MDKSLTAAKRRKRSASGWWPVFFIAPGLLVVAVFILLPLREENIAICTPLSIIAARRTEGDSPVIMA